MKQIKHAIVLAGGKGERLRPHTNDKPKPMVQVGGKPILQYIFENLVNAGITDITFACSYLHEVIEEFIGDGRKFGFTAHFTIEDEPLGRGGGIKKAMKTLPAEAENILVCNGDQLWQLDIDGLANKHVERNALATDVVVQLKSPYGIVEFNEQDEVLGFKEKPLLPHWINAGIYIFSREIEDMLPDVGDHETETFPKLPKERFLVFQSTSYWKGVDTVKDMTEAEKEVGQIFSAKL